jgi:predicted GH43/DUF377 family glycosyl hydrolase
MKKDYSKEIHATKQYLMELEALQKKMGRLLPVMFPDGGTVECQDIKVEIDAEDICMIMSALSTCKAEVLKWLKEKGEEQWRV